MWVSAQAAGPFDESISLSLRDGACGVRFPGISCLATIVLSLRDKELYAA
jgi:hypothetical protein